MPTTTNRKFQVPNTGADVGTWGSADVNPNFAALDNILGSVTSLNLAGSGPVALTDAQQQVAVLRFTGILTGNVQVTVTQPAFWVVENLTSGNFVVTITGGAGQVIATPQGSRYHVFFDGTDVRFADLGITGELKDLVVSAVPAWITACTVNPFLACVGGTALTATYPTLSAMLGILFGNPGGGLFSLPDLRGRSRFALDAGANRLTVATMTPDGNTIGATGGAETRAIAQANLPAVAPTFTGINSGVLANFPQSGWGAQAVSGGPAPIEVTSTAPSNLSFTPSGTISNLGSGTAFNEMPPAMVTGIVLIKT